MLVLRGRFAQTLALIALLAAVAGGCSLNTPGLSQAPTALPTAAPTATPRPSPAPTPRPTATPRPSATPRPTVTPVPITPTPTLAPLSAAQRQEVFSAFWELVRDRYVYADYHGLDWDAIRTEYEPKVAAASDPQQFYALLEELVDRLNDDHSRFDSPQEVAREDRLFSGELTYGGIGVMIHDHQDGGYITRVAKGGPADQAGLRAGDLILAIDGVRFTDEQAFGAEGPAGAVRGPQGTDVTLTVRSADRSEREVTLTRRVIPSDAFPAVEGQTLPGTRIGLLLLTTFYQDDLDGKIRAELDRLAEDGPLEGLIIDVRGNGGGRVDLMLNTVGMFVDGGVIGTSNGRDGSYKWRVPKGQTLPAYAGVPLVVLIDADTVSAAEMFAGGMQALRRARIVGVPSAGNVEALTPHDLPDGSQLVLAESAFRLPDGTLVEGRGIQPDRTAEGESWRFSAADDPQIKAAVEDMPAAAALLKARAAGRSG